jgi:hypothetical protein
MTADEEEDAKDRAIEAEYRQALAEDERDRRSYMADQPATDKQRAYAEKLGITLGPNDSKLKASDAIDAAKNKAEISHRQRMVLRFWGQDAPSAWTRADVSAWMDAWYAEDPRRLKIWENFKAEHGISPKEQNFMLVPWNAGTNLLSGVQVPVASPVVVAKTQVDVRSSTQRSFDSAMGVVMGGITVMAGLGILVAACYAFYRVVLFMNGMKP